MNDQRFFCTQNNDRIACFFVADRLHDNVNVLKDVNGLYCLVGESIFLSDMLNVYKNIHIFSIYLQVNFYPDKLNLGLFVRIGMWM